ncbi:MAG: alpha/beta hydrolase [Acidobacteria bacterium]|nr:MAG: alpha/beta hydrolase [Acidobacteriota bacterium]REK07645.1 MAG: alpha/beta hydrolase [Acidobacteriota bacterium]
MNADRPAEEDGDDQLEALDAPPSRLLFALETRALAEFGLFLNSRLLWGLLPRGDGHPVLVLPGFTTGDVVTTPLRRFLRHRGYEAKAWRQGVNVGMRHGLEIRMLRRLRELAWLHDQPVSIIGWSLGGIYAREIARTQPAMVRQVITLGSPFAGSPKANHVWKLYENLAGEQIANEAKRLQGLERPLPVPSTAIYSRTDGVVRWQCCVQREGPRSENVEVYGSHCGLGHNPSVLAIVADRLAQPEGEWAPFDPGRYGCAFFPAERSRAAEATTG